MGDPTSSGFLAPYRVLDLSDQRGLLAGWMFASLGADVVQVEPPGGSSARHVPPLDEAAPSGSRSLYWSAYAAGKRSVTCDLDQTEGRELFLRLVRQADFVFESEDPGVMARRGLGYAELHAVNAAVIHVSMTAFGSSGPKSAYADSELVVWASAGALFPARGSDGVPLRISVPQAYLHGAADAASGALIALLARHRTGAGQHVDVSAQQSAAVATLSTTLAAAVGHAHYQFPADSGGQKKSLDLSGSGARTRRSKWPVLDGLLELHLGMGPAAGGSANKVFAWMREHDALPEEFAGWDWVTLPQRIQNNEISAAQLDAARDAFGRFVARFTKDELMRIAYERGILMAPAMTVADLVQSPQLAAREYFATVSEGGRRVTLPARLAAGCEHALAAARPAPTIGQHNEIIYGTLAGLRPGELAALAARGIV
jgi:crotonobetainyl-CoA:carnitine CoA-transferase CaiB-like acyl-CoA transferase